MIAYADFLRTKEEKIIPIGHDISAGQISPALFPFQNSIVRWAAKKGRAAVFADTGLGKTFMQIEWARLMGGNSLIVAPLSVAHQTVREGTKIGVNIHYTRDGLNVADGINITNYEMAGHFDAAQFNSVVLDESSILKSLDGKTRLRLTEQFSNTPYKLCCTATPAPNDIAEIANHAEFLGIMTRTHMLSRFFVHDDSGNGGKWRLKNHGKSAFYRWLASWGMSLRKPSDLGYDDTGYDLPPLTISPLWTDATYTPEDQLLFTGLKGVGDRINVRRATTDARVAACADLVNSTPGQWIIWCGLNDESAKVTRMIDGAVEITGADDADDKATAIASFQNNDTRVIVTKSKIAGFGMNFQNCHQMAFLGMGDSWESYYQCIRRCYRFGQTKPVNVHIILSELEQEIFANIMRKESEAKYMSDQLIAAVREYEKEEITGHPTISYTYRTEDTNGNGWRAMLGDSCERLQEIDENSVDMSVFSPPFQSLYTYSPTERDLGNSANPDAFNDHFGFIISQLLRVTKPGRVAAVHVADIPAMLVRDGYIGLKDFSGDVIRGFIARGWLFDARVPIDKNQQAQSIRTHAKGLTFSQMEKDRTWSRPALPDYILKFRKPGDNAVPVKNGVTRNEWIDWANPTWPNEDRAAESGAFATWYGIHESDTLQGWAKAGDNDDERHICPLQLGTIERCIKLWSNPGDLVLSPFMGIGSEGDQAIRLGRRFIGIELKESYYKVAVRNLRIAEHSKGVLPLWEAQHAND